MFATVHRAYSLDNSLAAVQHLLCRIAKAQDKVYAKAQDKVYVP